MFQTSTEEKISDLILPSIAEFDYDIVCVRLGRSDNLNLQIFIEKKGGAAVTIDDCARVSRIAGRILDVENVVSEKYNLEVSSPGIERPLVKREDFQRFAGEKIKLKTILPVSIDGAKKLSCILLSFNEAKDLINIKYQDQELEVELTNIKSACLVGF